MLNLVFWLHFGYVSIIFNYILLGSKNVDCIRSTGGCKFKLLQNSMGRPRACELVFEACCNFVIVEANFYIFLAFNNKKLVTGTKNSVPFIDFYFQKFIFACSILIIIIGILHVVFLFYSLKLEVLWHALYYSGVGVVTLMGSVEMSLWPYVSCLIFMVRFRRRLGVFLDFEIFWFLQKFWF